jgi:hypothetical protein
MSEAENFKAAKEARTGVLSRSSRPVGHGDPVTRMVEAAFYRETHRAAPERSADDEPATETEK